MPEQVAKWSQTSPRRLQAWIRRVWLPGSKIGKAWRIKTTGLKAFLAVARVVPNGRRRPERTAMGHLTREL